MTGPSVIVQVLEGENAIARNREVMGATNPEKAAAGTIRLAKASVASLRFKGDPERAAGALEWLVTPEWLSG